MTPWVSAGWKGGDGAASENQSKLLEKLHLVRAAQGSWVRPADAGGGHGGRPVHSRVPAPAPRGRSTLQP